MVNAGAYLYCESEFRLLRFILSHRNFFLPFFISSRASTTSFSRNILAFEFNMPRVSFKIVFAFSATLSYALTKSSGSNFLSIFCQVYATCLFLWATYRFILYPNLFSPLRHIPTVDGNSWWSRQSLRLLTEPRGIPQSEWFVATFL